MGFIIAEINAESEIVSYFDGTVLGSEIGSVRFFSDAAVAQKEAGQMQRYSNHEVVVLPATQSITISQPSY